MTVVSAARPRRVRVTGQSYSARVGGTYAVRMGDRGRLVLPADLRARLHLEPGALVLLVETDDGVVLTTREQAKRLVRAQLAGVDVVAELLAERRRAAAVESDAQA